MPLLWDLHHRFTCTRIGGDPPDDAWRFANCLQSAPNPSITVPKFTGHAVSRDVYRPGNPGMRRVTCEKEKVSNNFVS